MCICTTQLICDPSNLLCCWSICSLHKAPTSLQSDFCRSEFHIHTYSSPSCHSTDINSGLLGFLDLKLGWAFNLNPVFGQRVVKPPFIAL